MSETTHVDVPARLREAERVWRVMEAPGEYGDFGPADAAHLLAAAYEALTEAGCSGTAANNCPCCAVLLRIEEAVR